MNASFHIRFLIGLFTIFLMAAAQNTLAAPARGNTGWPEYNDGYNSQRFSPLKQINTGNVADLKPLCEVKLGEEGTFESGPIVVGDVLYVTTQHTTVAMNAADCKVLWRNIYKPEETEIAPVNRGAAYLDGRIFRGYSDGRLVALDAKTGKQLWKVQPANPKVGEFLSSAPIAWHGLVFIGLAGSDWGIRGQMMAFDARTGKERWHFYTIPEGHEPGADTWTIPATVKHGGGGMWTSYTLDPKTGELFVPVANPAPDYDPLHRPGDNLFTDSVVVLDARTGKLKWWYQLTHNDGLDYDLGAAPMLYSVNGAERVALGSKDGYLYSLNRRTHKLVFSTAVTTIKNNNAVPTYAGVSVCPGPLGGVEWNGPAFDPQTHDIYVGAVDWCYIYKRGKDYKFIPGSYFFGTSATPDSSIPSSGWLTAVDAATGKVDWQFHAPEPVIAGVTPTAGGLVFTGDGGGDFYAFDAKSGKLLLKYASGGSMAGGVITYAVYRRQYVAFTSGNVSRMGTFNTNGSPTLVVMALNVPAGSPKVVTLEDAGIAQAAMPGVSNNASDHGQQIFAANCSVCHGAHGEGGIGPSLQDESTRKDLDEVIAWIKDPKPPMPKLYPKPLTESDVQAVAAYVETLKKP
ncbi:MAG TPA: PQQ-binding-like beta-propeller repeat protein [Gammaproteobacteria bacterium]|nr:PQQ-binding-like beta-propeller repeat protein [Gammaproteobacteria bacterium]